MRRKLFATLALLLAFSLNVLGQKITGVILDASTGDSLSLAGVSYKERKTSTIADLDGIFSIARINGATLTFSCMGYKDETVNITKATPSRLTIKLKPDTKALQEVVVKAERKRYVRKDNPAVELMKRVIDAKKSTQLENHDFYQYTKYQKLSMSLNDYKVKELDSTDVGKVKWTQQAELSPYNNKMVVPISLDETVTKHVFRKDPRSEKDIIQGEQSSGLNQLIATGDIVNNTLKEVFQDVDIYDNYVRLLKFPFLSPIGSGATSFYRYYITDTVLVDRDSCYHLTFTPNNPQDIGFNGDLYILKDSTLHVKKCHLSIPKKSDVNFVSSLHIDQVYSQLPNEEWALTTDDMWAEMTLLGKSVLVVRNTRLSDYDFEPLQKSLFRNKAKVALFSFLKRRTTWAASWKRWRTPKRCASRCLSSRHFSRTTSKRRKPANPASSTSDQSPACSPQTSTTASVHALAERPRVPSTGTSSWKVTIRTASSRTATITVL